MAPRIWGFDFETRKWDKAVCAVAISDKGDEQVFTGLNSIQQMEAFSRKAGGTWVAHAGGRFDLLLMHNYRTRPFDELILSGTTVLTAKEGKRLIYRDSYPWWLASLKKVGEAVGLEKLDVDRSRIEELTEKESVDYCRRDTQIELLGVLASRKFLQDSGARAKWTAGGCALSMLQALEAPSWDLLERYAIPFDKVIAPLSTIRGGRTEGWFRGEAHTVYTYDFKSSYPARYFDEPVGIGIRQAYPSDEIGVWRCRWTWPWRDRIPPALDEWTQAGAGNCEAWLHTVEIEAFERAGVAVKRFEGYAPLLSAPIGQVFARTMFKQKEAEKGAVKFCSKVWLNSLHGKYGEHPIKEMFGSTKPTRYEEGSLKYYDESGYYRWSERHYDLVTGLCSPWTQPIAGGQITARARVALWDVIHALQTAGWDVYYCDTDSIHTNCPPHKMPVSLGSSLGQLALEGVGEKGKGGPPYRGLYVAPKAYLLISHKTGRAEKGALKGAPLKDLADGVIQHGVFRGARGTEKGRDLQIEFFERALRGDAQIAKGGITTFASGLRKAEWLNRPMTRTIRPVGRNKRFGSRGAWRYLTPAEIQGAGGQ